ncbi:hypothetical protein AVEN_201760-1, partial [Araneus ventricosus]
DKPPLPFKLQCEAGITTIARLNKPFQNSEELLPLDVEHVEVGWIKHPSILLHESRISLEDGEIFYSKSGIYTDGSKTTSDVGVAFCVLKDNLVSYQWSAKLRDNDSVYQAELITLLKAVEVSYQWSAKLRDNNLVYQAELIVLLKAVEYTRVNYINEDITVFADNKASILASINPKAINVMAGIIFTNLLEAQNIYLSWIKAHSGYLGNEKADYFAKQAIEVSSNVLTLKFPISHLEKVLQKDLLTKWQKIWTDGDTGRSTYLIAPKVSFKPLRWNREEILFFTNHGPFPMYFHRFKLSPSPFCSCAEISTPLHYATSCIFTLSWQIKLPAIQLQDQRFKNVANNQLSREKIKLIIRHSHEYEFLFKPDS